MTADGGDGLGARVQNIDAFKAAKDAMRQGWASGTQISFGRSAR